MSRKFQNLTVSWKNPDNRQVDEPFLRKVNRNVKGRIGKKNTRPQDRLGWDQDDNMDNFNVQRLSGSAHYANNNRGHNRGHRGNNSQPLTRPYWYQILIVNGSRYTRQEILTKIEMHLAPRKYFPVCYQIVRNDSLFYVERFQMAQMLMSCTKKIVMNDGTTLMFRIKDGRPPITPVDDVMLSKIKTVMSSRFVAANKALDLSAFVRDPEFIDGLYCALNRPPIFAAVLKLITENIPDLHALNLSGNGIRSFENNLQDVKKLKSLRILHLSDNNIANLNGLNGLAELEIIELKIDTNPVLARFSDRTHLIRYDRVGVTEVRKRFPKLTKLDDVDLMPVVTFDVGEEAILQPPQAAFISVPEGRSFVTAFLSQYFQIYDSDNRLDLAQAYADDALFSLTALYPAIMPTDSPRLNTYMTHGRNLMRITDFPRRKNQLHVGKSPIVKFLDTLLPKTQHDLASFAVDLPIFTPQLISLSVTGLFRERGAGSSAHWPLRYFSRSFLIVPMGSGFCIVNEMLFVSNATEEQAEVAFKTVPDKPAAAAVATSPVVASPSAVPVIDDNVKLQMVQTVAEQTGMNLEWAKKCLEETDWDFNRAVFAFGELQKRGAIPPEAFIK